MLTYLNRSGTPAIGKRGIGAAAAIPLAMWMAACAPAAKPPATILRAIPTVQNRAAR
jgi:hypothetical protein